MTIGVRHGVEDRTDLLMANANVECASPYHLKSEDDISKFTDFDPGCAFHLRSSFPSELASASL